MDYRCFQMGIVLIAISAIEDIKTNAGDTQREFCDQDPANVTLKTACDVKGIEISIADHKDDSSSLLVQCSQVNNSVSCYSVNGTTAEYDIANKTLEISFQFHHQEHAGKYLKVSTTCRNETKFVDHILLIPCLSNFRGNATLVGTNITICCEHSSFNKSSTGIRIVNQENDLASCLKNKCINGIGLPDGVCLQMEYQTGMEILCKMDGAVLNLTDMVRTIVSRPTPPLTTTPPPSTPTTTPPPSTPTPTPPSPTPTTTPQPPSSKTIPPPPLTSTLPVTKNPSDGTSLISLSDVFIAMGFVIIAYFYIQYYWP